MKVLNIRINRATYWLGLVCIFAVNILISRITKRPPAIGEFLLLLICAPRLRDTGRSLAWIGYIFLGEIAVAIAALVTLPLKTAMVPINLYGLFVTVMLIWLGCIRGEAGPNRFGEPPPPGISFGPTSESS
jgi:uncharacterized membrane protein YhaH (DUF805 family)